MAGEAAAAALGGALLPIVVFLIAAALGGRAEPDTGRERPRATYLCVTSLFGVFAMLAGLSVVAESVVKMTRDSSADHLISDYLMNDDISMAVAGGILVVVGLVLFLFHDPKLRRLANRSDGPAKRVYAKALYVTCFFVLAVCVGLAIAGAYTAFEAIAPGVAGIDSTKEATRTASGLLSVALVAGLIFAVSWNRASDLDRPS